MAALSRGCKRRIWKISARLPGSEVLTRSFCVKFNDQAWRELVKNFSFFVTSTNLKTLMSLPLLLKEIILNQKIQKRSRNNQELSVLSRKCVIVFEFFFIPVTGMKCSYGKTFFPVTEISVVETEISVTGLARLLIWTHRIFYKGNRSQAKSR